MKYDGKILAAARDELDALRERNQEEHERRVSSVHARLPEIPEIENRLRAQMPELIRLAVSRQEGAKEQLEQLRRRNIDLQMRRAELLVENGYPAEYLDEIVSCPKCRDTGFTEQGVCSCLHALYNKQLTRELSSLLRSGDESFAHFDETLYSDESDGTGALSPRAHMRRIRDLCQKFAAEFPNVSSNLLLCGGPGLGKTYLCACIARTVAEKGCSVCYSSTADAMDAFENAKFSRDSGEGSAAQQLVDRMLDCELLILDDLGSEFVTQFSCASLYSLLNSRLSRRQPTVLSTGCAPEELEKRYTPQIASRIQGEFLIVPFAGSDIRRRKK